MKKEQVSFYWELYFDSQLSKLLQLVNTWLIELWDDCEHNRNGQGILWLQI